MNEVNEMKMNNLNGNKSGNIMFSNHNSSGSDRLEKNNKNISYESASIQTLQARHFDPKTLNHNRHGKLEIIIRPHQNASQVTNTSNCCMCFLCCFCFIIYFASGFEILKLKIFEFYFWKYVEQYLRIRIPISF